MSKNSKNLLLIGFVVIFFIVGFIGFKDALPENKNHRVYTILQEYFPYNLEKRTGGLAIVYKDGREKEKPSNAEIFHITDKLEKEWGKEYLKLENSVLIILDKDKKELRKIELSSDEIIWIKQFFGI
ncbi:hypothetical protein AFAEC_1653 [Aliarcobacter faecis]|uniref:hypothetical protein n=1 Tax=Aliarcobacter faecis TaxID=1564138 RepID=UPI0004B8BA33|nr:hypothetical protein [Aliarcobacter faecis]QKF73810.1 hypothetical protein AFAEC_1653 [Aliarcobacter faecis]